MVKTAPLGSDLGFHPELLKALHILTREGRLNQDSQRKLKQVKHLVQFITPLLDALQAAGRAPLCLVDHGAGKSYLGFMLWDQWFAKHGGRVYGVELREALVSQSAALAQRFGFEGMRFIHASTQSAVDTVAQHERIDLVTALHACDAATDDAISFGLARRAEHIVVVPCCQAEVAAVLRAEKGDSMGHSTRGALSELWRRPLHTREFGAQITNVLRCLRLEASGYKVTVTELVGWEHSMKNELILASRHPDVARGRARDRLQALLGDLGLDRLSTRFEPLPT
jgi:hypothetical protein